MAHSSHTADTLEIRLSCKYEYEDPVPSSEDSLAEVVQDVHRDAWEHLEQGSAYPR
jgi:hypothetical protein